MWKLWGKNQHASSAEASTVSSHFTSASNGCRFSLFTSGPQICSVSWYTELFCEVTVPQHGEQLIWLCVNDLVNETTQYYLHKSISEEMKVKIYLNGFFKNLSPLALKVRNGRCQSKIRHFRNYRAALADLSFVPMMTTMYVVCDKSTG